MSIKRKVYIEIEDYFKYTPFREDVSAEELLRKISNLTEFQCFVVVVMVNDFFAHEGSKFTDEYVKEIFNIEK